LLAALSKFLEAPEEWPLVHSAGYLAIFAWRNAENAEKQAFTGEERKLTHLAFHPVPSKRAPLTSDADEPEFRPWWHAFWKLAPQRSVDQEEATLYLLRAEAVRRVAPVRHEQVWEGSQSASLIAASAGDGLFNRLSSVSLHLVLINPQKPGQGYLYGSLPVLDQLAHALRRQFVVERDDIPPQLLYLAVRAARRALALNPNDAQTYLVLGESYLHLLHNTRERAWAEQLPELAQLRRCQATAALNQAVKLKPDFAQAHLSLSKVYGEMGYLDLALEHLRSYVKLLHAGSPSSGVRSQQLQQQREAHQQELSQLTKEVENRQKEFLVESAGWKVGDRALKAWQKGLAGKARDLLLESDIAAFGAKGMSLELELLLRTGKPKDVLVDWIDRATLGSSYHWMRAQAFAALGNYGPAQEECNELSGSLAEMTPGRESLQLRPIVARLIGKSLLAEAGEKRTLFDMIVQSEAETDLANRLPSLAQSLRKEADITSIRGLLALEQGDDKRAAIAFATALTVWQNAQAASDGSGLDFIGRPLAQGCLKWLTSD
jgi:tetratricopeptide (TPR) repeat protein